MVGHVTDLCADNLGDQGGDGGEPSVVTARRFSGSMSNLSYIAVTSPSVCARSART